MVLRLETVVFYAIITCNFSEQGKYRPGSKKQTTFGLNRAYVSSLSKQEGTTKDG